MTKTSYQFSEAGRQEAAEILATGKALGEASFEAGYRLSEDDRRVLTHWSRFGSDGYPVRKLRSSWTIESDPRLFPTKRAAVKAWEIKVQMLITVSGLEAQAKMNLEVVR